MSSPIESLDTLLQDNGLNQINFHGTDYAWGFREDEPIIALITKQPPELAFQSAMSLYWASADYISKPWCLLLDVEIPPHQKGMLENLAIQYNIQQVDAEKLVNTAVTQLAKLGEILEAYIPENTDKPVKTLGESIKRWRSEKPFHEYNYKTDIQLGNLDVYKENGELVPSRKTIPLTATSGDNRIDGILPRLMDTDNGLFFDTEHRNLPMVFKIDTRKDEITLRFEADKSNIIEATAFWGLQKAFTMTKGLAFIEPNTGDILFNCVGVLND